MEISRIGKLICKGERKKEKDHAELKCASNFLLSRFSFLIVKVKEKGKRRKTMRNLSAPATFSFLISHFSFPSYVYQRKLLSPPP